MLLTRRHKAAQMRTSRPKLACRTADLAGIQRPSHERALTHTGPDAIPKWHEGLLLDICGFQGGPLHPPLWNVLIRVAPDLGIPVDPAD